MVGKCLSKRDIGGHELHAGGHPTLFFVQFSTMDIDRKHEAATLSRVWKVGKCSSRRDMEGHKLHAGGRRRLFFSCSFQLWM